MDIDIEKIRQLAELAMEKNLAELKVEDGDKSVTLKMPSCFQPSGSQVVYAPSPVAQAAVPAAPLPVAPAAPAAAPVASGTPAAAPASNNHIITSPMVGTFYRSPSPESPAYADAGQTITVGQTLCIIEAMKLMNELESEVSGTIVKVLAENGQPVEFGQPLFEVALA
jgi:acetyl-CoA carboxylase biotin carboxyl carrier protein